MTSIASASGNDVQLELWQPEGVTILEGDPRGRGFTLHEDFENGARGCGFFECDPGKTTYYLEYNEYLHVIEGEARIELDDGSSVDLRPGDIAYLPKGHLSTWTFKTRFREFWVLCD